MSTSTTSTTKSAKTTSGKAEGVAIGRSGQISQREQFAGKQYGVDVMRTEHGKNHEAGVVPRAFATEEAATEFARKINQGKGAEISAWYKNAHSAIVVPVWPVPAEGDQWPWETKEGEALLAKARKAPLPK